MNASERKDWERKVGHELARAKRTAIREIGKIENELRSTIETLEYSVKKSPREAAIVALSLGAALGAVGIRFLKPRRRR